MANYLIEAEVVGGEVALFVENSKPCNYTRLIVKPVHICPKSSCLGKSEDSAILFKTRGSSTFSLATSIPKIRLLKLHNTIDKTLSFIINDNCDAHILLNRGCSKVVLNLAPSPTSNRGDLDIVGFKVLF